MGIFTTLPNLLFILLIIKFFLKNLNIEKKIEFFNLAKDTLKNEFFLKCLNYLIENKIEDLLQFLSN